jgi:hypothetical protein
VPQAARLRGVGERRVQVIQGDPIAGVAQLKRADEGKEHLVKTLTSTLTLSEAST